ncbi:MAG: hypothetical protein Q9227_007931 [Pyrenula ochraceoflavens]
MFPQSFRLSPTVDFHAHLRDAGLMELVVPTIKAGGCDTVYVMPNLQPPITTAEHALSYRSRLQALAPDINFLMTLYLHPSITPATIAEAAKAGIVGVKVYPAGVTTNSEGGVLDFEIFYPVFEAMQEYDMVLNLHGEVPSTQPEDYVSSAVDEEAVTVLNAEPRFLPTLRRLHAAFPRLRIALEHCTTKEAIETVRDCGPTVAATITAHHLWMTVDDWCSDAFSFCKPVAKRPVDRIALLKAAVDGGGGKFFFGSDSAPHTVDAKKGKGNTAAGCFTQGWATQLVIGALEEAVAKGWIAPKEISTEALEGFLSSRGSQFYKLDKILPRREGQIQLARSQTKIPESLHSDDGKLEVVPFRRGQAVWSLEWGS